MSEDKKIKIRVKVKPEFFWTDEFEVRDLLDYDMIDQVRRDAIKTLTKGMNEKDIKLSIETEVIFI